MRLRVSILSSGISPVNPVMQRASFLDQSFDQVDMAEAVDQCLRWCSDAQRPRILLTLNASILVRMRSDDRLRDACAAGDLVVPDGVPVVWASRLTGASLKARVAGIDLMQRLLEAADTHRLRIYFLGARQEVLDTLIRDCKGRYPGIQVVGSRNGYFSLAEEAHVIRQIEVSSADILFVGMPTPFKECWCEEHRDSLGARVIVGVGGSFDVLAGYIPRAPRWMQATGLEWCWRLIMEPRKLWKRYLVTNSLFVWYVLREYMSLGGARGRRSVSR
jgi:N-acetylglucosaminyldiphosphoundecaprenol N-acetyl-beta-D-mannosaminyltransferase